MKGLSKKQEENKIMSEERVPADYTELKIYALENVRAIYELAGKQFI